MSLHERRPSMTSTIGWVLIKLIMNGRAPLFRVFLFLYFWFPTQDGLFWSEFVSSYKTIGSSILLRPCCGDETAVVKKKHFSANFYIGGSFRFVKRTTSELLENNKATTCIQSFSDEPHNVHFDREIQNKCETLIFCISSDSLQLITQLEVRGL